MTHAICFGCGGKKFGAFSHCDECGAIPRSDDELMLSLTLTDHHLSASELNRFSESIKAGRRPQLPESEKEKLRPAIAEAKRLLGSKNQVRATSATNSKKKFKLFNSAGLTLPFFAAVASLTIFWTLYVGQQRMVRQSEVLEYGIVFGLLSGVVLFAVMRAFDRGRTE